MKRFPSLLVKLFSFLWLLKLSTFVEALNDNEVVVATREDGKTVVRFLLDADYVYSPPTETTEWWYTISDNSVPFVSVQLVYNAHGTHWWSIHQRFRIPLTIEWRRRHVFPFEP